jgi:hypothetical protein
VALLVTWVTLAIDAEEIAFWTLISAVVIGFFSFRRLGRVCAALAVFTFITLLALEWNGRQGSASNAKESRIHGLPADTTNILYALHGAFGRNDYYEFDTTEQEYRRWVARQKFAMEPVREKHDQGIIRFRPGIPADHYHIPHALVSDWVDDESPDCGLHMYYDLDAHRAYYWWHSR